MYVNYYKSLSLSIFVGCCLKSMVSCHLWQETNKWCESWTDDFPQSRNEVATWIASPGRWNNWPWGFTDTRYTTWSISIFKHEVGIENSRPLQFPNIFGMTCLNFTSNLAPEMPENVKRSTPFGCLKGFNLSMCMSWTACSAEPAWVKPLFPCCSLLPFFEEP